MRRQHLTQLIGTLAVATALIGLPTVAFAGIEGSGHDLSLNGWGNGEICEVCHTPHNADTTAGLGAPLWDHEVTTQTYTLYTSTTLDGTVGQPTGVSKLCLSCHDGSVAIDSFGGTTGTTFMGTYAPNANFGTDLSNDHPISIDYNVADIGLNPITDPSGLPAGGDIDADMLFAGNVECASCHDVHRDVEIDNLLVKDNAASALCLTCHNK